MLLEASAQNSLLSTELDKIVGSVFLSIVASEDFNIFLCQTVQFHNLITSMFLIILTYSRPDIGVL